MFINLPAASDLHAPALSPEGVVVLYWRACQDSVQNNYAANKQKRQ